MDAGQLPQALVAFTNSDWADTITFYENSVGLPIDLTGCNAQMDLKPRPGSAATTVFTLSTANARLSVQTNSIVIFVDKAVMATVAPGTYDFQLRVFWPSNLDETWLVGQVQVTRGLAA